MNYRNLIAFASLVGATAFSQDAVAQQLPKLVVKAGEVYTVGEANSLQVDTLVMHDGATIKFSPTTAGQLIAKVAHVGAKCTISSKGADGENGANGENGRNRHFGNSRTSKALGLNGQNGEAGQNGSSAGSVDITIHFASLGSLTIDARGGNGGDGGHGGRGAQGDAPATEERTTVDKNGNTQTYTVTMPSNRSGDGGNAGAAGLAGNGGDVFLTYSSDGFLPNFNRLDAPRSITIRYEAGKNGKPGKPGRGGENGHRGATAPALQMTATDGKVTLLNANQKTAATER